MNKIAIITPCVLPVPAVKGGAVEGLITRIIDDNEIAKSFEIDLYTIADDGIDVAKYKHTRIVPVEQSRPRAFLDRAVDKVYRSISGPAGARRLIDLKICEVFDYEAEYDAVIVENQASVALKFLEYPLYFHVHNEVDIYRSPANLRTMVEHGVEFIAVSEFIKEKIIESAPGARVQVLLNGVDLSVTSSGGSSEKNDEVNYLYSGRVIPDKGVYELVQAFERVDGHLTIVGFNNNPTKYEEKVLELARKNADRISCIKKVHPKDVQRYYQAADVVVMPTLNEEPFGLVALETMAMGLPIIVTNSGALHEVVGDEAGLIIEKGEGVIENLTQAMNALKDPELRRQMGEAGRKRANSVSAFDIRNYYGNFREIIVPNKCNGLISVIVPVYNVSHTLNKCVQSILDQTYKNIEVILVDDGSTDESGQICDKYASCDNRVRVIHQENRGLSAARNTGIDIARGEYLFFVDSDDWIVENTFDKLFKKLIWTKADIACCGFSWVYDDGREVRFTRDRAAVYSGRQSVIAMMRTNNVCTTVWNKLYRASLWDEVRFPVGRLHEDEATSYKLLYKASKVVYIPDCLYKYYQNRQGIMNTQNKKRNDDFYWLIDERIEYFVSEGDRALAEHSVVSALDHTKYIYRNASSMDEKRKAAKYYKNVVFRHNVPQILGRRKTVALFLWYLFAKVKAF